MTTTCEEQSDATASTIRHLPDPAIGFNRTDGKTVVSGVNEAFCEMFGEVAVVEGTTELGAVLSGLGIADAGSLTSRLGDGDEIDRVVTADAADEDGSGSFLLKTTVGTESGRLRLVGLPNDGSTGTDDSTAGTDSVPRDSRDHDPSGEWVASTIAHDIRNPLDVAEAHLEVGRETGDATHFESVSDAHDRIETIITNVLTFVREDEIRCVPVDLEATARTAWESVRTADATLTVDSPLPQASGDCERLERLFENLFRNAVEHAGPDPAVRIGHTDDDTGFYVTDDGPGVPAERRADLFESGVSADNDGTGLGLAISAQIVEAHGWQIHLSERDTGGARFDVTGLDGEQTADCD